MAEKRDLSQIYIERAEDWLLGDPTKKSLSSLVKTLKDTPIDLTARQVQAIRKAQLRGASSVEINEAISDGKLLRTLRF